ncbi:hypothetical protein NPIL_106211 [Nephila pilipes]|uniref:Uncharacterized protein n=1 Tax=Nephila pilipes TaxID=299642 RepID=A0A8X6T5W2_NEPPI|nr:hypothetical protein NPIL_106211 [Nephila pilipes]
MESANEGRVMVPLNLVYRRQTPQLLPFLRRHYQILTMAKERLLQPTKNKIQVITSAIDNSHDAREKLSSKGYRAHATYNYLRALLNILQII